MTVWCGQAPRFLAATLGHPLANPECRETGWHLDQGKGAELLPKGPFASHHGEVILASSFLSVSSSVLQLKKSIQRMETFARIASLMHRLRLPLGGGF